MILAWIHDIVEGVQSFATGMRTTGSFLLENLRGRGGAMAITRQYPEQPAENIGARQRGHLYNDAPRCIVCHACDKVCPVDCFVMDAERDEQNKMRCSRFDIDLSKCIYCGLCVRACPTDSLSMTPAFELDPLQDGARYLFRRNSGQSAQRLEAPDVERLQRLAMTPRAELTPTDRDWLDACVDPTGPHLIGMYGLGHYTADEKVRVEAARQALKQAKDAAAAAAKAAAPPPPPPKGPPQAAP